MKSGKKEKDFVTESGLALSGKSRIFYEAAGSGSPVIFLHGGCLNRRMWDPQFGLTARHWRVIRYDMAGFGKSPLPEGSYPDLVEDLNVLFDWLGLDRACLVGLSLGAAVAIDFALAYPAAVGALVLAAPGLSGYRFSAEIEQSIKRMVEEVRAGDLERAMEHFVETWVKGPREAASPGFLKQVRAIASDYTFCHYLSSPAPAPPPARKPAAGRLNEVTAPALVLVGDQDQPDIHAITRLLAGELPNARLCVISGTAHLPNIEQPERFNREMLDFLGSVWPVK